MRNSRLWAAAAAVAAVSLALAGCSSSGSGSSGSGKAVTLKLVVADYGTGPANTSEKYWKGIASDFHKKNPSITVNVTAINWNSFDSQVQTMVQNKQYPDITEGDYFSTYAQEGLLYPAKDIVSSKTLADFQTAFKDNASIETAVRSTCIGEAFGTLFKNASTSAGIARFATNAAFSSSSSDCFGSFPCHSR